MNRKGIGNFDGKNCEQFEYYILINEKYLRLFITKARDL
jgi:hypothetical protein